MAKKIPLTPLSPEARAALLHGIAASGEPQLAKSLATMLAASHPVTEAQVTPVLDELAATGVLKKYAPAKGKPKYWDRDLQELTRDAVLRAVQLAKAPLTAKEIATSIAPPKVAEADVMAILESAVAGQRCFVIPAVKPSGKPAYWHQDLRSIGRDAVLKAALQAIDPFTAKELAGQLQLPFKISENDVTAILEESVANRTLHAIPATTAKAKPRYWTHDILELGSRATIAAINTKGPQTLANLKKVLKGFSDSQFEHIINRLRDTGNLIAHPPLGAVKQELWGTRHPSAASYFKDLGAQFKKVVNLLKGAQVPAEELRRSAVQLLEEAGISFGSTGVDSRSNESRPAAVPELVDLLSVMKRIEPGAERGALVGARELRNSVQLAKPDFDHAVLELARQGRLSLHRHDYVTSLTQEERDELVSDGEGTFYVGMAIRPR